MKLFTALLQAIVLIAAAIGATAQAPATSAQSAPIGVGAMAPEFTLGDQDGNKVTLTEARSKGPVVLVFYRGYW